MLPGMDSAWVVIWFASVQSATNSKMLDMLKTHAKKGPLCSSETSPASSN